MRSQRNRCKGDRGAMIVQMAVSSIAFLALASLAVDYGVKLIARTQAQTAADSAALAGAMSLMVDDPNPVTGPAKVTAQAFAWENKVWGSKPAVDLAQLDVKIMPPDANTTGADCTTGSPCVRVDVYRNSERADSSLPTFFSHLFGVFSQGVKATATAQVGVGNASRCMLPFGVADRWADYYDDHIVTTYYPNDGSGTTNGSTLADAINGWSPNDNYQSAQGDIYKSPVYYPAGQHTGWTVTGDYGRQLILKFGGTGSFSSGWASRIDEVGSTGGSEYQDDIENCNINPIAIAPQAETCAGLPNSTTTPEGGLRGCVSASTGVTEGPTKHGIETVTGRDPLAHWSWATPGPNGLSGAVVDGSGNVDMSSSRIRPLVVFDINHYMAQGCSGSGCTAKVANIIGFFVEGMCPDVTLDLGNACEPNPDGKRDVVGRIVTLPADFITTGGTVASNAAFLKTIMLVR
jgi:hypothetical protein